MDRLPSLIRVLSLALSAGVMSVLACDSEPPPPVPSRVDAIAAPPSAAVDLDSFCEARPTPEAAPAFVWPPLTATSAPAPAAGRWTWINVWATWCAPCLAEMPTIVQWPDKLAAKGAAIDLRLLSVDEDRAALSAFVRSHPEVQGGLHMQDGAQATAWMQQLGLDINPVLPLHILVDPQGRTRCVRSGALDHSHMSAIAAVVSGG